MLGFQIWEVDGMVFGVVRTEKERGAKRKSTTPRPKVRGESMEGDRHNSKKDTITLLATKAQDGIPFKDS